jgi:hypothetical protein
MAGVQERARLDSDFLGPTGSGATLQPANARAAEAFSEASDSRLGASA